MEIISAIFSKSMLMVHILCVFLEYFFSFLFVFACVCSSTRTPLSFDWLVVVHVLNNAYVWLCEQMLYTRLENILNGIIFNVLFRLNNLFSFLLLCCWCCCCRYAFHPLRAESIDRMRRVNHVCSSRFAFCSMPLNH